MNVFFRNLCDILTTGKLNAEQFALAMYLVQQAKTGLELPQKLTPEMVPPSMRAHMVIYETNFF